MDRRVSVLVASIPHTGTFFVLDSIFKKFHWQMFEHQPTPGCKQHRHLFQPGDDSLMQQRLRECVTVVPLRSYASVKSTWLRNGLCTEKLKRIWQRALTMKNVFFLTIDDVAQRDKQLATLSDLVGEPLQTDWRPVNSLVMPA